MIRAKRGRFLAIPTENAPRRGVGGKRISLSTFPEHRFGPLRFVPRPSGPWLHHYNHHRPHAGINAATPVARLNNLPGNDI